MPHTSNPCRKVISARFLRETACGHTDGLKADGCGPGRDLPALAALLNQTGRPVLIENCHYYKWPNASLPAGVSPDRVNRVWPYWKDNVTGGELICQENLFRASGDISNSWGSWFGNLAQLAKYQDEVHPISQPGCWAYGMGAHAIPTTIQSERDVSDRLLVFSADMLMVGVFANPAAPKAGPPHTVQEWRSHFGAWCINSSPLVLSFNLTNVTAHATPTSTRLSGTFSDILLSPGYHHGSSLAVHCKPCRDQHQPGLEWSSWA